MILAIQDEIVSTALIAGSIVVVDDNISQVVSVGDNISQVVSVSDNLSYILQTQGWAEDASQSEQNALVSEQNALVSEQNALVSEQNALVSEQKALVSEQNALVSEQNTSQSEQNALVSEQNALVSEQNALVSEQNTSQSEQNALVNEQNALVSEQKALVSEQKASQSEQNASQSEQNALVSEQNTSQSEQNTSQSEQNALVSEQKALVSEQKALVSEQNALVSEQNALVSEQNTSQSEQNALVSEQNALVNEQNALVSEQKALVSEQKASQSEQNASQSEQNALVSEQNSEKWATEAEDVEIILGKYSAYHWAQKAREVVTGSIINDAIPSLTTTYSSNKIESELSVKANENTVVKLTGNQTKDGVLTFTSSPIVPTPTAGFQAVNKDYADNLISSQFPFVGFIGIYSGSPNNIPQGWFICNGQNGTPNLTDRFVIGASSTRPAGTTSGSFNTQNTTLSVNQMPSHSHSYISDTGKVGEKPFGIQYSKAYATSQTGFSGGNQGHNHSFIPPYYALAYIMYKGV
jgi:peptidoglycan hydrolase CwlO-like protein